MVTHRKIENILKDDDYGIQGEYLIHIHTNKPDFALSHKVNGIPQLTEAGKIVEQVWKNIPEIFDNVLLKEFIIIDDKIYGLIDIDLEGRAKWNKKFVFNIVSQYEIAFGMMVSKQNPFLIEGSLFHIINWFKASSLLEIRKNCNSFMWQSGYYECRIENKRPNKLINLLKELF